MPLLPPRSLVGHGYSLLVVSPAESLPWSLSHYPPPLPPYTLWGELMWGWVPWSPCFIRLQVSRGVPDGTLGGMYVCMPSPSLVAISIPPDGQAGPGLGVHWYTAAYAPSSPLLGFIWESRGCRSHAGGYCLLSLFGWA